tara:strand:- start:1331 stop:1687 length:357 start_codon:yes stop_codon:yes gene_type:complete
MENVYRANVAIGGDTGHTVVKNGISVPELAVLRHLHGTGAIDRIVLTGKEKMSTDSERERLVHIYKEKFTEIFGAYGELPFDVKSLKISENQFLDGGPPINAKKETNGKEHNSSSPAE